MNKLSKKSKVIILVSILAFFIVAIALFFKIFLLNDTASVTLKQADKKNNKIEVNSSDKEFEALVLNEIGSISSDDIYYEIDNVKTNDLNFFDSSDIDYKKRYAFDNLEFFYQYDEFNNCIAENKSYFDVYKDFIKLLSKNTLFIADSNYKTLLDENMGFNIEYIDYSKNATIDEENILNVYDVVLHLYNKDLSNYKNIVFLNSYNSKYNNIESLTTDYIKISSYIYKKNPTIKTYFAQTLVLNKNDFDTKKNYNNFVDKNKTVLNGQYISLGDLIKEEEIIDINRFKEIISYISLYTSFIGLKENEFINKKHITKEDIKETDKKELFLTFDDGSCDYTLKLLDILKNNDVKATFFVTNQYPDHNYIFKKIIEQGHSIGAHTFSHNYNIYKSKLTYFDDLYKIQCLIRKETNSFTNLIRFPGGSVNSVSKKYNKNIMKELVQDVEDMGYIYYDWNISSGDGADISSETTLNNIIAGLSKKRQKYIVLSHDTKINTVNIIDTLIKYAKNSGFTLLPLKEDSYVCHMVFK